MEVRGMRPVIVISSWVVWMVIHCGQSYPLSCGSVNVILRVARGIGCDAEAVGEIAAWLGRGALAVTTGKAWVRGDDGRAGRGAQAVAGLGEPELRRTQESWRFCTGVWKESKPV